MSTVKIAVTSDLHLPITTGEAVSALVSEMADAGPDVVVLAGDIAETLEEFDRCLIFFRKKLACPILVLPGNHDLWSRGEAISQRLWQEVLPARTTQTGCVWFEGQAFVQDGVAVAGTIAWYDYSAADRELRHAPDTYAREKRHYNVDALLIDWRWSDPEFAEMVARPFLATLDRLEADPAVRQTIVVTHVPLLEGQMCRRPQDRDWGFSNAYFGNLTLGREVLTRRKVSHIISGHTHVERQTRLQWDDGRVVQACVLPSDYRHPAWLTVTVESLEH